MKILLCPNKTVGEIREEFNNLYPYLGIAFFIKSKDGKGMIEEASLSASLSELNNAFEDGEIDIKSTETVKEIEQKFEKQYGLLIHISRKQNGIWMNTTITDDLTLQEQNTWGREASKPLKIKMDGQFNRGNLSLGK